jgi:hypothetical protein
MRFHPPSPTNFFVRERLRLAGAFNEAIPIEDRDTWLRVARAWDVAFVDQPLATFRVHGHNTSTTSTDKMHFSNDVTFAWAFDTDPQAAAQLRSQIVAHRRAWLSAEHYHAHDFAGARRIAFSALGKNPLDRLAWRMLVRSTVAASALGPVATQLYRLKKRGDRT